MNADDTDLIRVIRVCFVAGLLRRTKCWYNFVPETYKRETYLPWSVLNLPIGLFG